MRRKRRNKQRKLILIISLSLLFILTVGYAAFQTNLNITAKGNILEKRITIEELRQIKCNQTAGDGLYQDADETNRCIYRGTNPDNYILFNNELWRIIAIEQDNTLKIIKKDKLTNIIYDTAGTRYQSSGFCNNQAYGCKVWGSKTTMLDSKENSITKMPREIGGTSYELPSQEASINTYLNSDYYNTIDENSKSKITNHIFNIGLIKDDQTQTLQADISQEKDYKWKGEIGLINATDFVKSSTDTNCNSTYASRQAPYPCQNNNYLKGESRWTMSSISNNNPYHVWFLNGAYQSIHYGDSSRALAIHPVIYLNNKITLKGEGTENKPYTIIS